jgi:hypothetical protein
MVDRLVTPPPLDGLVSGKVDGRRARATSMLAQQEGLAKVSATLQTEGQEAPQRGRAPTPPGEGVKAQPRRSPLQVVKISM